MSFTKLANNAFLKQLSKNYSYLFLVKIFNLGSKYLMIAYLVTTLGKINYGTYTWLDSIIQFFILFANYGFNSYLAKNVIEASERDESEVHTLISNIFQLKFSIFILGYILLIILTVLSPHLSDYKFLLYLYMFIVIGEVFFPIWYFQGIQKFKNITFSVFILRLIQLIAVVLFVKNQNDITKLLWIMVISNGIYGLMGVVLLKKELPNFNFRFQKMKHQKYYLKEGFMFFLGIISTFVFNYFTIYLIGIYFGKEKVTEFDIVFKVVFLFIIPFEILQQALFPIIVRSKNTTHLKYMIIFASITGLFLMGLVYLNSAFLISLFGIDEILQYQKTFNKVVYLIPIVALTYVLGSAILIPFGHYKEFNQSLVITSLLYFLVIITLFQMNAFSFENLIIARVFADIILLIIRAFYVYERKVLISK